MSYKGLKKQLTLKETVSRCIFYQRTRDGERCILVPPEEWKIIRRRFLKYCYLDEPYERCPIYIERYLKLKSYDTEKEHKA